jgi:hypothetical protein
MRYDKETAQNIVSRFIPMEDLWAKHKSQAHVAFIVKRGKIIECATNSIGSRSRGCGYDERMIHAERAVLKKLGDIRQLNGAVLIVIRFARGTKEIVNSEPCHTCKMHLEKCIKEYGLKCVYYS